MKISKKIGVIITIIIILIVAILSSVRIYALNSEYPNPEKVFYNVGEEIKGGDISINVTQSKLIDGKELKSIVPDYVDRTRNKDGSLVKDNQTRYLLVNMKLKNNSDKEQKMEITRFVATSKAWYNGIYAELFMLLNKDISPVNIKLEPNSEKEVVIPYVMYNFQFTDKNWKNIDNRQFELVLSEYPYMHIVLL